MGELEIGLCAIADVGLDNLEFKGGEGETRDEKEEEKPSEGRERERKEEEEVDRFDRRPGRGRVLEGWNVEG